MDDQIIYKTNKGVYHIVLNRPEKRNALTRIMYAGIADGIAKAENDPDIRIILIYGNGKCFCAGNDLKDFQDLDRTSGTRSSRNMTEEIIKAKKPILAAVHGYAVGIGVTMLLHFDLVYAEKSCRFQFPFVNLGLVPEFGSTFRLPQLIGYQRAAELFFFGDWFTAQEAEKMGIINKIFSEEHLITKVILLAENLAEKPPTALQKTKELIKKYYIELVQKFMPEEGAEFVRRQISPEAQEAFRAFFERRKPDFSKFS
ncbi:MAG: enoyl-CoA hydratase [Promethearchaeota archaeon]